MNLLYKFRKNNILFILTLFLVSYSYGNSNTSENIKFVETTGRAVIENEKEITKARRNALEDAIFIAAMSGGAKINGFSSVNKETIISDHFTIEAESKLLDFDIIKEEVIDNHYEIKIKAALGHINSNICSERKTLSITVFKPFIEISNNSPAWVTKVAEEMAKKAIIEIENSSIIQTKYLENIEFTEKNLSGTDDEFDYKALTTGKVIVHNGDLGYVPSIKIDYSTLKNSYEKNSYLNFNFTSNVYRGETYDLLDKLSYEGIIKINTETPWRTLDIIAKKSKKQLELIILSGIENHISDLIKKIKCVPLNAKIKFEDEKLYVTLGTSHGIIKNTLGFSNGENTPYTIFKVTETTSKKAFIEPFNKNLEITSLIGKNIDFIGLDR